MSDYESVEKKIALRARMDPLFGRALASNARAAIDRAYFLSQDERTAFVAANGSPSGNRPPISSGQATAMVKLGQMRSANPALARALATTGLSALRDLPFSGTEREHIHAFVRQQGVQSIEEWHHQLVLDRKRNAPRMVLTTVSTEPYARCIVGPPSGPDREQRTRRADSEGLLTLQMPEEAAAHLANGQLPVFCEEGRSLVTRRLDYPAKRPRPRNATGRIRPALSANELMRLSTRELIARGYPPRPSPAATPDAYAHWVEVVTSPAELVASPAVNPFAAERAPSRSDVLSSPNWSGWAIKSPAGLYGYQWVTGLLNTPQVQMPDGYSEAHMSMWVGINGIGRERSLLQAGVELDLLSFWIWPWQIVWVSKMSWVEYPTVDAQQDVGLPFNPGDAVGVSVFPSDRWGNLHTQGGYVTCHMSNGGYWIPKTIGPFPPEFYFGYTAEWIIEKKVAYPLSNYGTASIVHPVAEDSNGRSHTLYGTGDITEWTLMIESDGSIPSLALVYSPYTGIVFDWLRPT